MNQAESKASCAPTCSCRSSLILLLASTKALTGTCAPTRLLTIPSSELPSLQPVQQQQRPQNDSCCPGSAHMPAAIRHCPAPLWATRALPRASL